MKKFVSICLVFLVVACQKDPDVIPPPTGSPLTDTVMKNVAYGEDARQNMDLYLPAGRSDTTPVIIMIHGGGWSTGDKNELSFFGPKFQQRGFALANINYRLSPASDDNFKMQLDDIQAAINHLQANSTKYAIARGRFYATGHSAGGHLALSYAYTRNGSGIIKAAGAMGSPTNLHHMAYYNPVLYENILTPYLGAPLSAATEARYKAASPYFQATSSSVPTILIHAGGDLFVGREQSEMLDGKLQQLNVPHRLVLLTWLGHDWWTNGDLIDLTVKETAAWFQSYR